MMEKDPEWAHKCIDKLIVKENVVLKTKMAAYCLALGYKVEEAVTVLEKVSSDSSNGIFGFNAQMTLKVWRENGYLKIYQK